jgi:site-specific DNA recombinase
MARAARYLRISDDREGEELGVGRQDEDTAALAQRNAHTLIGPAYVDNDRGASTRSRKRRPAYERMIEDARAGCFDVIIAYTSGRLTRRPREHEDLIELAEQHGIRFEYVRSPSFDLGTAAGRRVARILAANDAGESEDIAERIQRTNDQRAAAGKQHGGHRPYGWEPDRVTVRETEAAVIREATRRALAGEALRSICRDLNARGLRTAGTEAQPARGRRPAKPAVPGAQWTPRHLRQVLLNARHAGLRRHRGAILDGVRLEPAIIEPADWWALERLLTAPDRVHNPGRAGQLSLLSGLARCAKCRAPIRSGKSTRDGRAVYRCPAGHVTRDRRGLEDFVTAIVVTYLSKRRLTDLWPGDGGPEGARERAAAERESARLSRKLTEAREAWKADKISMADWLDVQNDLGPRLEEATKRAAPPVLDGANVLAGLVGPRAAEVWPELGIDRQRAAVALLLNIEIGPGRRGAPFLDRETGERIFDPTGVTVTPLTSPNGPHSTDGN